jgi:hypothetical protein
MTFFHRALSLLRPNTHNGIALLAMAGQILYDSQKKNGYKLNARSSNISSGIQSLFTG